MVFILSVSAVYLRVHVQSDNNSEIAIASYEYTEVTKFW